MFFNSQDAYFNNSIKFLSHASRVYDNVHKEVQLSNSVSIKVQNPGAVLYIAVSQSTAFKSLVKRVLDAKQ